MTRLHIVCEGQTEETFVREVLIPTLCPPLIVDYSLVETSPGHKGGALSYPRVQRHLRNILRQTSAPFVTTLFDLYRLDSGFPGYAEAVGKPLEQRLRLLNEKFHERVVAVADCRPGQFLPYIQPYEFEPCCSAMFLHWSKRKPNGRAQREHFKRYAAGPKRRNISTTGRRRILPLI